MVKHVDRLYKISFHNEHNMVTMWTDYTRLILSVRLIWLPIWTEYTRLVLTVSLI